MATWVGAFSSPSAAWTYLTVSLKRDEQVAPWRDMYRLLESYYLQNGAYESLEKLFGSLGTFQTDLRGLRNPAFRVCEFYASKIWGGMLPDALPIVAKNKRIIEPIHQIWQWSNWSAEKQTCARWFALYGDLFIKVASNGAEGVKPTRVFMQNIKPEYVSEMDADERGYLTYARIDIPRTRRQSDGKNKAYTHTETWDKTTGYRLWEHEKPIDEPLDKLGTPTRAAPLSSFGIDFVPIVWMPFRAIGDERGTGAFTLCLEKIDEANRQATRLHQMLFRHNKAFWALRANATDKAGRPLPPPRLGGADDADTLEIEDDTILKLPGMSELQSLVPSIDYAAALEVLNAQLKEIKEDLPELAYYSLREMGEPSGVAVRLLLSDALDRLLEARGNAETALVRAQQMALSMGAAVGLPGFTGIGTYAAGDFEHAFAEREVFPLGAQEKAAIAEGFVKAGFPVLSAARMAGFSDEELAQLEKDLDAENERTATMASAALEAAETRFDRGENEFRPGAPVRAGRNGNGAAEGVGA